MYSRHGIEIQSNNMIQDKIQRNTTEYRFSTMCEMYPNPEGADPKLRAAVDPQTTPPLKA